MEAIDNGYDGTGGIKTASFSIQVAVAGINDAPVVAPPPPATAVPGEIEALPGFLVLDPDTDTDGRISEGMLEVRLFFSQIRSMTGLCVLLGERAYVRCYLLSFATFAFIVASTSATRHLQ